MLAIIHVLFDFKELQESDLIMVLDKLLISARKDRLAEYEVLRQLLSCSSEAVLSHRVAPPLEYLHLVELLEERDLTKHVVQRSLFDEILFADEI
jgi:hypothetical protein